VPLLVEWPDGRRAALLFVIKEATDPQRFCIHRLAHDCLDLAELFKTDRVVPVVIFLHRGDYPSRRRLGSESTAYLDFHHLSSALFAIPARETGANSFAPQPQPGRTARVAEHRLRAGTETRGLHPCRARSDRA
jgi:hypothetical protein